MIGPALAGLRALAGVPGTGDAFAEGQRVLQEAKDDFDASPTPEGALALYAIGTWLITWAAATGSPPRPSAEFQDALSDVIHTLDRVRRRSLELE
jgi:hypothetical protein